MSNHALVSDAHCELDLAIRRMRFLTNLLTTDNAQNLSDTQVTDLHFWLGELARDAQTLSNSMSDAIDNAKGGAK